MKQIARSLPRGWYFLLCYLAFSAFTIDYVLRSLFEPELMAFCHINAEELHRYYNLVFWGNAIGVLLFGCLVDILSYKSCFIWVWIIHILGLIQLILISPDMPQPVIIHKLSIGLFLSGLAEGGIFAIIHPLIAFIFNNDPFGKTKIISYLHTNWPVFMVVSVLFDYYLIVHHLSWRLSLFAMLVFPCFYLIGALLIPLPQKSFAHSIPLLSRIKSTIRPGFFLLFFCMAFLVTLDHSPRIWIRTLLETKQHLKPIPLLLFFNTIQVIFRLLGGSIAQKISPPGLLCFAALLSTLSLELMSVTTSIELDLLAAALFAISIAWYGPAFIAIVIDRYPLSGAFGMALINFSGFIALIIISPSIAQLAKVEGSDAAFLHLSWYSLLAFILLAAVYTFFRSQGGYKVLSSSEHSV